MFALVKLYAARFFFSQESSFFKYYLKYFYHMNKYLRFCNLFTDVLKKENKYFNFQSAIQTEHQRGI